MPFRSPYIKVDCSDGPRFILRNPEKAFLIAAPYWDTRIKSVIDIIKSSSGTIDAEVSKKFQVIAKDLGKNYAELQSHYQAAYLQFVAAPCSKEANASLAAANEEIRKHEFQLREIEIRTEQTSTASEKASRSKTTRGALPQSQQLVILADELAKLVSDFHP